MMNERASQQDRFSMPTADAGKKIFGVYDGHGGDDTADLLKTQLPLALQSAFVDGKWSDDEAKRQCLQLDKRLATETTNKNGDTSHHFEQGTTATFCVVDDKVIRVGVVGDSPIIQIDTRTGDMTRPIVDHKPENPSEKARIEKAGSGVYWTYGQYRLAGIINISRTFGDHTHKGVKNFGPEEQPMIAVPDLATMPFSDPNVATLLFSDGLTAEIATQTFLQYFKELNILPENLTAEHLSSIAHKMCTHGQHRDNTTVVILFPRASSVSVPSQPPQISTSYVLGPRCISNEDRWDADVRMYGNISPSTTGMVPKTKVAEPFEPANLAEPAELAEPALEPVKSTRKPRPSKKRKRDSGQDKKLF